MPKPVSKIANQTKERLYNSVEKMKSGLDAPISEKKNQTINTDDQAKGMTEKSTQNTYSLLNNAQERNIKSSYQSNRVSNMRERQLAATHSTEERAQTAGNSKIRGRTSEQTRRRRNLAYMSDTGGHSEQKIKINNLLQTEWTEADSVNL